MRLARLLVLLCPCLFGASLQAQEPQWVATWGTATALALYSPPSWVQPPPADKLPPNPPPSPVVPVPPTFAEQSLRMIVRSSVAGAQLRLQFSSALGTSPTRLGAVHVALHTGNGSIDVGSDRVVTFGGSESVTLHPGALVVSDPVDLALPPLSEVAVSIYLPEVVDTRSFHELGLNTTYVARGNTVGAASFAANDTNRSYFWLTGLEVLAPAGSGSIVAFGDSITDGYAITPDLHRAWPALLAQRLQADPATARLGVINMGISGNRVLRELVGSSALTRFDRDVLARGGVEWMLLLEGINDINFTALPGVPVSQQTTAEELIEGLSQLVTRAHARGIKVMGGTLLPMGGLWLHNPNTEALRQAVNAWIRTGDNFDAVVDFDALMRDPANPERLHPDFDSGDFIHPNDAGAAAMAEAIDLQVFAR
jgi:lysophospholipase L1-like esterase